MIDEIIKDKIKEITNEYNCVLENHKEDLDYINLCTHQFNSMKQVLEEILDKYNNQEKGTTIFIDTEDMEERYGTQLYIEYLEKYKKSWEELVKYKNAYEDLRFMVIDDYFHRVQELEQKHGIKE